MVALRIHNIFPERFAALGEYLASFPAFRQIYYSFLNPTSIWVGIYFRLWREGDLSCSFIVFFVRVASESQFWNSGVSVKGNPDQR